MRFNNGAKLFGMRPEIFGALLVADDVYGNHVGQGVTVTHVTDGKHGSVVHSVGCAADIRTRYENQSEQWLESTKNAIAEDIRKALTDEFDVVVERDHIHIELDKR